MEIMRDPRVRAVPYRDLLPVTKWEIVKELLLVFPWFLTSLFLAHKGYYYLALPISFIFFLTGLRVVHNAYHYVIGISKGGTEWVMFALSLMMQSSMHALQLTHLHHHKHCMDDEDAEAASARMHGWQAILFGPYFYYLIHKKGIEIARPRNRAWIAAELTCIIAWIYLALFVFDVPMFKYHVLAMTIGQCLTAFFAVWTVHHDCDRSHFIARTLRNRLKSIIAFEMFFHVEHHLFPSVPTCHLHQLSKRLDEYAPELSEKQVY